MAPLKNYFLLAFGLTLSSQSFGAAFYFPDSGARSMSRGSAFVANPSDLSALYHNPAGLARLRQAQAYINFTGINQYVEFDRTDEPDEDLYFDPIYNEGPLMLVPALGISGTFGLPKTTFALGVITPQAPNMAYPADGPQRYSLARQLLWEFAAVATVGHQFTDWLAVGAGFNWKVIRARQELTVTSLEGENTSQDIDLSFEAWDKFTPSFNAGILLDPVDWLSLGVSYQPSVKYAAKGEFTIDFEGHVVEPFLDQQSYTDDDIQMLLHMPSVLRMGVNIHPNDRFDVELDLVNEGWTSFEQVTVTDLDLKIGSSVMDYEITDDVVLPAKYENSWSFRLGSSFLAHPRMTLSAGGLFETSAVPKETQGVLLVDNTKIGYGLGTTIHLGDLDLDASFAQLYLQSREITNSELQQIVLDLANGGEVNMGKVVGNGHFASHLTMASVAMSWKFGPENN